MVLRKVGVTATSYGLSKAPLPVLRMTCSDAKRKKWEERAEEAERLRDNAVSIGRNKARVNAAKHQIGIANYAYGIGAIEADKTARAVKGMISTQFQGTGGQQLCSVADRIMGELAGSAERQIQGS